MMDSRILLESSFSILGWFYFSVGKVLCLTQPVFSQTRRHLCLLHCDWWWLQLELSP